MLFIIIKTLSEKKKNRQKVIRPKKYHWPFLFCSFLFSYAVFTRGKYI